MRAVNEIIPAASRQLSVAPAEQRLKAVASDAEAGQLINDLIRELRAVFPAWRQAWPTTKHQDLAKVTWTKAIVEAGISDWSMIERGLRWCRSLGSDFIPSAGKFMEHCWPTPEELGAPDEEVAYWEAQRNSHPSMVGREAWSHRAVYHAATACGRHSLMTLRADVGRLRFAKAYREVIQRIASGEDLPEPVLELPADVHRKGGPAKASDALAAMRASLSGRKASC